MIEFKLQSEEFQKVQTKHYFIFVPSCFEDKDNEHYPSNIYSVLSKKEMVKPSLEEQFEELFSKNSKIGFQVQFAQKKCYYIAKVINSDYIYETGKVRVYLGEIDNFEKSQYNHIKDYAYFYERKNKIDLRYFSVDIDKLIDINRRLVMKIKYSQQILDYIKKGSIYLRSNISKHIYSYKISSYKISSDQKIIEVFLLKSNRLMKKDYIHLKKINSVIAEGIYKSLNTGRSVLILDVDEIGTSLQLKIKNTEYINILNKAVQNGMIKFVFNKTNDIRRVDSIQIKKNKDYTDYYLKFYEKNFDNQTAKEYLKDKRKVKDITYNEINFNTTVKYYEIPNKNENTNYQQKEDTSLEKKVISKQNIPIIEELQIIDSSNNHVTRNHKVTNQKFYIKIKTSRYDSGNILIEYNGHYCNKCKNYFDFKQSFILQLRNQDVPIHKIESRLIDDNGKRISVDKLRFELYNKESDLHSYGYKVGHSGISKLKRQKILDKLIYDKVLSVSEIKDTLNRNISTFKGNKKYEESVTDWKNDLDYINKKYY